jgi:NhaD family Na+/H+ antiporter
MKKLPILAATWLPSVAWASQAGPIDLTFSAYGMIALAIFTLAYVLVILEEYLHLSKSKPVLAAAGLIWLVLGWLYSQNNLSEVALNAFNHNLLEYAQLFLFLLVAMTYINALEERGFFYSLKVFLENKQLSLRQLFWVTGMLAFVISSFANNLTTAMLMCAIVMNVASHNRAFIALACVNIVGANAGGTFSPFGDITTLMIWQAGKVDFLAFFVLLVPAIVNFIVPAAIMSCFIKSVPRHEACAEPLPMKRGAKRIFGLFLLTILSAVLCHSILGMPPVLGMMFGLSYLKFMGYYLVRSLPKSLDKKRAIAAQAQDQEALERLGNVVPFNVFSNIARSEWDTLMFFYGIVLCVGGLGFMGYLHLVSEALYVNWSPTYANIAVGIISAIVDNIPVVFAVLAMDPVMSTNQWLLIALTAGVGGSMLSIGSAAGVALMGQTKGIYSFVYHLKWSWAIAMGYVASIATHLWLNGV